MKRKTLSNRTFISMIVAIVLLVVMCAGATYAYFTDKLTVTPTALTFGEIDIEFDGDTTQSAARVVSQPAVTTLALMPGDVIQVRGTVKNTAEAAFVKVSYVMTFATGIVTKDLGDNLVAAGWTVAHTGEGANIDYEDTATLDLYFALQSVAGDGAYSTGTVTAVACAYGTTGAAAAQVTADANSKYTVLSLNRDITVPTTINNAAIGTSVTLTVDVLAIQQANVTMNQTTGVLTSNNDTTGATTIAWTPANYEANPVVNNG